MYRQKYLTCIIRNIHVKYQLSSILWIKVKFSDIFTECQKDGMTEWKTYVNIETCSILEKQTQLVLLKFFFRKYDKNSTFIFAKCPKNPKAVGGWEKLWQNLCRKCFNLHDTNNLYPSNIASKHWHRNVDKIFEGIDSFSKLLIVFEMF